MGVLFWCYQRWCHHHADAYSSSHQHAQTELLNSTLFLGALLIKAQWFRLHFIQMPRHQNRLGTYSLCVSVFCSKDAVVIIKWFSACIHFPTAAELLMLSCFLLLNVLFVFTSLHTPYTHLPSAPWAPHETPHCCSAASRCLLLWSPSSRQADSQQSLTRLFSAAAAVTADDPLDLFHGILMWFDMQRGLCRSHNTCLNTLLWLTGSFLACWI